MRVTATRAATIFGAFAAAYFLSALLRAVTATLAPVFGSELALRAGDLGLLAGAYFFGFAASQLPLGRALDRFGPRRTLLALLAVAVLGCAAFASATELAGLVGARMLIGVGVGACLMAPLTAYRSLFTPAAQLRANSWMLMTGSLGMVASTLPVQWALPLLGWRGLFWLLAGLLALAMLVVAAGVPRDLSTPHQGSARTDAAAGGDQEGYAYIVRHPLFVRTAPAAFFIYGGLIAVQALWAGPWMTRVGGSSAADAAQGLFGINLAMLLAFLAWGALMPRLAARGIGAVRLMAWGLPFPLLWLAVIVGLGPAAGALHWALWCVGCTFVSVSQPAVGAAFPARLAGRALSAFNLVIFAGVFCVQWGIGIAIDALQARGLDEASAFRCAFAAFAFASAASYGWFLWAPAQAGDNRRQEHTRMAAILIVAHAPLASALQSVAAHAFPERRADVAALDIAPETPDPEGALRAAVESLGTRDVLVLVDAFGATPCNVAQKLAEKNPRLRVVAGVNVPMLWRALGYADSALEDLVSRAIVGATQGVMHASSTPRQNQPSPPLSHDQVHGHDQQ